MDKDLLAEIYSDISALNKVIKNEITNEQNTGIVDINLNENNTVTDFLAGFSHNNVNNKIIHLDRKRTLHRQLDCIQLQKKIVGRILR